MKTSNNKNRGEIASDWFLRIDNLVEVELRDNGSLSIEEAIKLASNRYCAKLGIKAGYSGWSTFKNNITKYKRKRGIRLEVPGHSAKLQISNTEIKSKEEAIFDRRPFEKLINKNKKKSEY